MPAALHLALHTWPMNNIACNEIIYVHVMKLFTCLTKQAKIFVHAYYCTVGYYKLE